MYLEERLKEKLTWDAEAKEKLQGLFVATRLFECILALSVVFDWLESVKPLATKWQKQNQDIFMAYSVIDIVMSDLKRYWENIDKDFKICYKLPKTRAQLVNVQPSVPRLAKRWSRSRCNVENDALKSYHKRAVAVPFPDDVNSQLQGRLKDRDHIDISAFLPSIMSANIYNIIYLCKIHKETLNGLPPFCSILSAIGTITFKLAKTLLNFLTPSTVNKYTVFGPFHFAKEICQQCPQLTLG